MEKAPPLYDWYGYDKEVIYPEKTATKTRSPLYTFNTSYETEYSDEIKDFKNTLSTSEVRYLERAYFPACDGFTDQDFIADFQTKNSNYSSYYNWRCGPHISRLECEFADEIEWRGLSNELSRFFRKNNKRTDRLFRSIEVNEFIHRGKSDQTLKDFIETDSELAERCRNLEYHNYSNKSLALFSNYVPTFLTFGDNCNAEVKNLILKLTQEEFSKLVDFERNPYSSQRKKSIVNLASVKAYVAAAFGEGTLQEVQIMTAHEIRSKFLIEIISSNKKYWENLQHRHSNNSKYFPELLKSINSYVFNNSFSISENDQQRFCSYVLSNNALDEMNPHEVLALMYGISNPSRWATKTDIAGPLETIIKMSMDGKVSIEFACRMIAYIVSEGVAPICVNEKTDFSGMEDTLISWAHSLIPQSKAKKLAAVPVLVRTMKE